MIYAAQTPILGAGTASAAAIQAWIASLGPAYIRYAPDNRYQPPPADLGTSIVSECRRYPEHVVNHDLVAAQIVHETAAWQSHYARERNNPGGIGAINSDPDQATRFESVAAGVRAHVAHLLTYAVGDGPWTADTPRYSAVRARGWVGVAPRWIDLNGRWAYPGTSYGQSIISLANRLMAFAASYQEEPPLMRYPKPTMIQRPSPNRDGYSSPRQVVAICNHIATGSKASNLSWLTNPASGASSNAYIDKSGQIYELVPITSSPWTNGQVNRPDMTNDLIAAMIRDGVNPNTRTYTIEHEGEPNDDLTPAQIAANNEVTAWVASETSIEISRETIIGHYQIDSVNRPYCPSFTASEWSQLIDGARALLGEDSGPITPTLPSATRDPWGTNYWILDPFIEDIRRHAWMLTGFCRSGAFLEEGKIVQYFERARLELQPDGSVTRGLLGNELLALRHPERAG